MTDGGLRRLREILEARGIRGERLEAILAEAEAAGVLRDVDALEALAAGIELGSRIGRPGGSLPEAGPAGLPGGLRRFEAQIAELQSVLRRVAEQLERRRRDRERGGSGPPRTLH